MIPCLPTGHVIYCECWNNVTIVGHETSRPRPFHLRICVNQWQDLSVELAGISVWRSSHFRFHSWSKARIHFCRLVKENQRKEKMCIILATKTETQWTCNVLRDESDVIYEIEQSKTVVVCLGQAPWSLEYVWYRNPRNVGNFTHINSEWAV